MIKSKTKLALLLVAWGASLTVAVPVTAQQPDDDVVYIYYYLNENNEQTGYAVDYCGPWGVNRAVTPNGTFYVITDIYAYCRRGQLSLN